MTDEELIKLLRTGPEVVYRYVDADHAAADRIEELLAKNDNLFDLAASEHASARATQFAFQNKLQAMHRRAQKAEGKLSRTYVMLTAVHGYLKAQGTAGWWMMQHVKAARRHSRQGSGAYAHVVFGWRQAKVDALKAQALKDAKAHEKEIAVWSENYAALEQKVAELTRERDEAIAQALDAAAITLDVRGQQEQVNYGLGRETQNFYRARDLIRARAAAIRKGGE